MSHETLNLNADAPIERDLRDAAIANAGATPAPVSHDTGEAIYLTQTQALARLQQGLEFPAEDDVTLLAQGTDLSVAPTATAGGAAAAGTTPGATTAGTTPGTTGAGTTPGTTGAGASTAGTTAGTPATGTGAGATTTGATGGTTATGADGGITLVDLNTLGVDHVVADLTRVASSDLEHNQGNILMDLGLETTATGQQAAAELLALLETFDEPIFNDAANVGVRLSPAERAVFDAASTSVQDDIVTAMIDLGVDFVNVVGSTAPDDAPAV